MPPSIPPPQMTWGRALPVLALCVIFDAARLFFEGFWFFGPAFLGIACTSYASGYVGNTLAVLGCGAAAGAAGFYGLVPLVIFGTVMAMTVGLFGWATVTLLLLITNPRLWKAEATGWIWSIIGLGVAELPLLGALPTLTVSNLRLYAAQIKHDKKTQREYQDAQAAALRVAQSARQDRAVAQAAAQAAKARALEEQRADEDSEDYAPEPQPEFA